MTDFTTFVNETATLVAAELPLQSISTALVLIEAYVSDVGGWIPDDASVPNGDGQLANGFTEQQTADAVTTIAFNSIYDLNFEVSLIVNVQLASKLTNNLDLDSAAVSVTNRLAQFVTDLINDSELPLRVESIATETAVADRAVYGQFNSDTGESTTADIRQSIQADIEGTDKIVDYKASTLLFVRTTYGLDNTWNVTSVYTELNQPITLQIRKYTTTLYTDLDTGSTSTYVFTVSPITYGIVSGVILNR